MGLEPKLPAGVRVGVSPKKGRGIFATRDYAAGEVVEVVPVLVIPTAQQEIIVPTILNDYVFGWGDTVAIAFGYGSLYNHSWQPNCEYKKHLADLVIEFVAVRPIAAGEEIVTNYASSYPEKAGLWSELD
ncbi:MAG: SET domain-containing protein-lysine N-methyltransferase [Deltaproteobacteria bacterium]|jgi:hypothetical protein|nr:SET domain-containing protein-lysine N-methyltransferase [Deltaproteobacteria bacterium]